MAEFIHEDFLDNADMNNPYAVYVGKARDTVLHRKVPYGCDNGAGYVWASTIPGEVAVHINNSCDSVNVAFHAFPDVQTANAALAAFEARWPKESLIDCLTGMDCEEEYADEINEFIRDWRIGKYCQGYQLVRQRDYIDTVDM